MEKRKPGRPKTSSGRDLRGDLLAKSRELLDEGGPAALSMREVARRAGCTHQAPYHYFSNREAILAALVVDGFLELAKRLDQAHGLADSAGIPAAVEASGNAYVEFALTNPGVFRVMFRPDMCNPAVFPSVQDASARARAELARLARLSNMDGDAPEVEGAYWAHAHGLACLLLDGLLGGELTTLEQRLDYARRVNRAMAAAGVSSANPRPAAPRRG